MPYSEEWGGAGQPYEVYLQALEKIGGAWASVGVGLSVHVMSCFPLVDFGSDMQKQRWLEAMLGGELLGGYCPFGGRCPVGPRGDADPGRARR